MRATELFVPATGKFCKLKGLPGWNGRYRHTLNNLVLCGGALETSCIQFDATPPLGSWTDYGACDRVDHAGFAYDGKILLLGGWHLDENQTTTAEIVGEGVQYIIDERSSPCGITDGSSVILTGAGSSGARNSVQRYNLQGLVETLPDMIEDRYYHACGMYIDKSNTKTYVVAGGLYHPRSPPRSSSEILQVGGNKWMFTESLPRGLYGIASASLENSFLIIGGTTDGQENSAEILEFDGTGPWRQIGTMDQGRQHAAAQVSDLQKFLNITNCI